MKFGKRFKAAQRDGWVYLDYKGLKQLVNELARLPHHELSRADAEARFLEEVLNGVSLLNAFFLEKEQDLLMQLSAHATVFESDAINGEHKEHAKQFFFEVSSLYAFVILNYLALLKILKKHDKHALQKQQICSPMRDHIFQQAFYLSLEHSYLFSEVCRLLKLQLQSTGEPDTRPFAQEDWLHFKQEKTADLSATGSENGGSTTRTSPAPAFEPGLSLPWVLSATSPRERGSALSTPTEVSPAAAQQAYPSKRPSWTESLQSSLKRTLQGSASPDSASRRSSAGEETPCSNIGTLQGNFERWLLNAMTHSELDFATLRNLSHSNREVEKYIECMLSMSRTQEHLQEKTRTVPVPREESQKAVAAASSLPILGSPKALLSDCENGTVPSHTPPCARDWIEARDFGRATAFPRLQPRPGWSRKQSPISGQRSAAVVGASVELKEQIHARLRELSEQGNASGTDDAQDDPTPSTVRIASLRDGLIGLSMLCDAAGEGAEAADTLADDAQEFRTSKPEPRHEISDGDLMFDINMD